MTAPADIFLSYSRDDQAAARYFAEGFEREGFSVWWDVTLNAGEDYDQITEQALRSAKAVVVLWSAKSVASRWVRTEATIALQGKTLVPVTIEACQRPIMFELTQTADLCHWSGDSSDAVWLTFLSDVQRFVQRGQRDQVPELAASAAASKAVERSKPSRTLAANTDAKVLRLSRRSILSGAAALLVAGILVGLSVSMLQPPPPAAAVKRFAYTIPDTQTLRDSQRPLLAVSPDGQQFVYNTTNGLYLRSMGELEARLIAGTEEELVTPVFSPDSQHLAYFSTRDHALKRIPVAGGTAVTLAPIVDPPFDASWSADGSIFYSQVAGIFRIPATGGSPTLVVDTGAGEARMTSAELLPDGDTLLFAIGSVTNSWDRAQIVAQSLSTGVRTVLVDGGSDPHYLPTGHLVYGRGDELFGVAFDAEGLTVSGAAVVLAQGLLRSTATTNYGIADDGTLVYLRGSNATIRQRELLWVSRDGSEQAIPIPTSGVTYPRISPDGSKVAIDTRGPNSGEIWIWDFARETRTRMIMGDQGALYPVWSPDGADLIAVTSGTQSIVRKAANNTGAVELLREDESAYSPYSYTPDAQQLVLRVTTNTRTYDDIGMLKLDGSGSFELLVAEAGIQRNAELSPNGRWMAYQSDESGSYEIYVRPFPDINSDKIQVSNAGGMYPLWSRDGSELFYLQFPTPGDLTSAAQLISVPVELNGTSFDFGARNVVMDWPYAGTSEGRSYDVAPDGQRFLALRDVAADTNETADSQVIIVQNWIEEVKQLLPVEPR